MEKAGNTYKRRLTLRIVNKSALETESKALTLGHGAVIAAILVLDKSGMGGYTRARVALFIFMSKEPREGAGLLEGGCCSDMLWSQ